MLSTPDREPVNANPAGPVVDQRTRVTKLQYLSGDCAAIHDAASAKRSICDEKRDAIYFVGNQFVKIEHSDRVRKRFRTRCVADHQFAIAQPVAIL